MSTSLVGILCRTSDRSAAGARGVEALAPLLGKRLGREPRMIGTPGEPRAASFEDDLRDSRGCLLEAGGQVDDALSGANVPVLVAGDCSICITTLPAALSHEPEAKVLWLDAHGDFNTPDTTSSGFLGGMCLAAACGLWEPGIGGRIAPERVVLAGVRELDPGERLLLEQSAATVVGASVIETLVAVQNALDGSPVYVHLDLDVLDPESFPAELPAAGGLRPDKLYDLLEAVADECRVVGLEVTAFQAPEDDAERDEAAATAMHVLEPLLDALPEEAHVGN